MLITLNQLKASLVAFKDWVLARIPSKTSDLTNDSGFITANDEAVKDVQVNGTSILDVGVANIPVASAGSLGVVKIDGSYGIQKTSDGLIYVYTARDAEIKAGTNQTRPLSPKLQHASTFYGLAKASGDTTQSESSNPVGTYTDSAKTSIKTMLGVEDPVDVQINGTSIVSSGVANIPMAIGTLGLVNIPVSNGAIGIYSSNGTLYLRANSLNDIKSGTNSMYALKPDVQHISTFYGLAKAAGDATQSASSNAVGTYTDEAKSAIQTMLGVDTAISEAMSQVTVNSIPTTEIDTLFA